MELAVAIASLGVAWLGFVVGWIYGRKSAISGSESVGLAKQSYELTLFLTQRQAIRQKQAMVAHMWANQSQPEARTGNDSFSFKGPNLYSWGTPVGMLTKGVDGGEVALITSQKYSDSTSAHCNLAAGAVRHDQKMFRVHDVLASSKKEHQLNMARMVMDYDELVKTIHRKRNVGSWMNHAANMRADIGDYCAAFGLKNPKLLPPSDEAIAAAEERAKKAAEAGRRRIREEVRAWRSGEKHTLGYEARNSLTDKDRAARKEAMAAEVERWRAGETYSLPVESTEGVVMRIKGDEIETSMGARFPVEDGLKMLPLIERCREVLAWAESCLRVPVVAVDGDREFAEFSDGLRYRLFTDGYHPTGEVRMIHVSDDDVGSGVLLSRLDADGSFVVWRGGDT